MAAIDWVVLVAYLAATVAIGACFYKGQKSTKDFFLAGRSMSWIPVGISVVATLFSAISYTALPSVTQKFGLIYTASSLGVFFCIPIVNRIFMPFYCRLGLYSAYEYLEMRFDARVRCLASGIFIIWRVVWMSVAVYAPSLALWAATNGKVPLIPTIIVLGLFATFYTVLGGMKAVIWTDVIQFFALFGGMVLASVLIIFKVPGGVATMWHDMHEAGKTAVVATLPSVEQASGVIEKLRAYFFCGGDHVTLLGILMASFIGHVAFYTADQVVVQRYFTTKSLRDARRCFWLNSIANLALHVGLAFLGMALFAYFLRYPHPDTIEGLPFRADWKYPYFISTAMPAGIAGVLIAALYAATMSSVDSGINSCTTAFMVDFWRRLKLGQIHVPEGEASVAENEQELRLARVLTLVLGVAVTVIACFVGNIAENIIQITSKVVNSFCGPMFAIFILGMLTRKARPLGVCIGAFVSLAAMWYCMFWTELNFLWPSTLGLVIALGLGYGISLLEKAPDPEKLEWTYAEQKKKWAEDESDEDK